MIPIPFVKVVGTGNDFILIDGRQPISGTIPGPSLVRKKAKAWCDRQQGIGADGILWVGESPHADAQMRIFNSDGSQAAMCGNGLRCVAWYLHTQDHGKKAFQLKTGAGILKAKIVGPERVRIDLPDPQDLKRNLKLTVEGKPYRFHSVNTAVPHAVHLVSSLEAIDLRRLGPSIRSHRAFRPAGTNVDLVQVISPHRIRIRTYERGVEAETLACGTGAVAAVVVGAAFKKLKSPVQVTPPSKEPLVVSFVEGQGGSVHRLTLEGPARICFRGVIPR